MQRISMGGTGNVVRASVMASVVAVGVLAGGTRAAAAQSWSGALSGSQQVPPNASPASGFAGLTLAGNMLTVNVTWAGITGGPLAAGHIHCCALPGANAAVAVPFVGLPTTLAGTYNNTFDLMNTSVYTSDFLAASGGTAAGAEAALIRGLNAGQAYVNLHNATYPGGEIRANVVSTAVVPEPTSFALAALGLGGAGVLVRRRRHG